MTQVKDIAINHTKRVQEIIATGQTIVIIRDTDNEAWNSGYVDYLMANYNYVNLTSATRFNLEKPL